MDEPFAEAAPFSYLSFSDDGTITGANDELARLLGYSPGELLGEYLAMLMTPASRIFHQTHLFPLLKLKGRVDEIVLSLRAADGEEVPVFLSGSRVEREDGAVSYCAMLPFRERREYEREILQARRKAEEVARNNDELVRTKRELEESSRLMDRRLMDLDKSRQELARVSEMLSHDLREPVRKISWFTDLLAEEVGSAAGGGSSAGAEDGFAGEVWVHRIRKACLRADTILGALREFVALEVKEEAFEPVDLAELVVAQLRDAAGEVGARVEAEVAELPVMQGLPDQLRLLFRRLPLYMLKHLRPGTAPHVAVRATVVEYNAYRMMPGRYRYEPVARLSYDFNWRPVGVPLTDESFDALRSLRLKEYETGLGLALCRKVVDKHRGSITVETGTDVATRFTILLPLGQE